MLKIQLGLTFITETGLVGLDFVKTVLIYPIATLSGAGAHVLKPHLPHNQSYFDGTQRMLQHAVDFPQNLRRCHQCTVLARLRFAVIGLYQFLFQTRCLEMAEMAFQQIYLRTVEPIHESAFQ